MGSIKSVLSKTKGLKESVLKIYSENHTTLSIKSIAYRAGTTEERATKFIKEYHLSLVAYFDFGIAPSMSEENTFFLFSDNGLEKKLTKDGKKIYSHDSITPLEALYIKINLGYKVILNK
jgi:hypothetical protein